MKRRKRNYTTWKITVAREEGKGSHNNRWTCKSRHTTNLIRTNLLRVRRGNEEGVEHVSGMRRGRLGLS